MKKRYEVEIDRHANSPRSFWTLCNKRYEEKTGMTLEAWIDSYEEWAQPRSEFDISAAHEDWDFPQREVAHSHPYEFQIFFQGAYNVILEWFDGHGYMYAVEYER